MPRTRCTGDDAPYGDHFVVWGTCAPDEATEDHVYDVMTRVRAFDQSSREHDPNAGCPECGGLNCNGELHPPDLDERV